MSEEKSKRPTFDDELIFELANVSKHEALVRAPMQRKLLEYLAERTLKPKLGPITQYDIATQALGRPDSFDENSESYVRVQVSRLRKTLQSYYSLQSPSGAGCIYIKTGSYALSLATVEIAYPELKNVSKDQIDGAASEKELPEQEVRVSAASIAEQGSSWLRHHRIGFGVGVLGSIAFLLISAFYWPGPAQPAQQYIGGLEQPYVSLDVGSVGFAPSVIGSEQVVEIVRAEALRGISRSIIAQPADLKGMASYNLEIKIDARSSGEFSFDLELRDASNDLLYRVERDLSDDPDEIRERIEWEIAGLVSPPGVISRNLIQSIPQSPRNDFECFVLVEVGRTGDETLEELVDFCKTAFSNSDFYPYLRARELFSVFQNNAMTGATAPRELQEWSELSNLLASYPENPYLNALASKILYAEDQCKAADWYADRVSDRSNGLPIIELMVLSERTACLDTEAEWAKLREEAVQIAISQREPNPWFEAVAIALLLQVDRPELAAELPEEMFALDGEQHLIQVSNDLRSYALGRRSTLPVETNALVWGERAREFLLIHRPA